ncbi:hypothetical protein QE390_001719 [Siphonobacter sp. SORGH_AS 1065]|nr:hypothetical protein [Siphonobacter sp. SORGH_AS_1065]
MTLLVKDTQVEDFFDRVRQVVREEIANNQNSKTESNPYDEWGGKEVAREVTGWSDSTIYKKLSRIPHAKQGGKLFFNRGQLLDFIKNGQRTKGGKR